MPLGTLSWQDHVIIGLVCLVFLSITTNRIIHEIRATRPAEPGAPHTTRPHPANRAKDKGKDKDMSKMDESRAQGTPTKQLKEHEQTLLEQTKMYGRKWPIWGSPKQRPVSPDPDFHEPESNFSPTLGRARKQSSLETVMSEDPYTTSADAAPSSASSSPARSHRSPSPSPAPQSHSPQPKPVLSPSLSAQTSDTSDEPHPDLDEEWEFINQTPRSREDFPDHVMTAPDAFERRTDPNTGNDGKGSGVFRRARRWITRADDPNAGARFGRDW